MNDNELLARLAGELWAVYTPWRGPWTGGGAAAVYAARRAFRQGVGLPWRHGGRDSDEREKHIEALGRMEREGLLARHVEKTKVTAVRLTDFGIERACELAGAPDARAGWRFRERLGRQLNTGIRTLDRGRSWVPEWALAGTPDNWAECGDTPEGERNRAALATVESRAIPALVAGWVDAGSDLYGRVWYAAGPVERPAEAPEEVADKRIEACGRAWDWGARSMRRRLAAEPRRMELGLLPLPCAMALVEPAARPSKAKADAEETPATAVAGGGGA